MPPTELHLRFQGVSKAFGAVRALEDVTFGVRAGSVHALLGENGAGKSTLLKVLSGAHVPSHGALVLGGAQRSFASPAEAFAAGIAVIYQELQLVPEMTVAENVFLGHMPARFGLIDRAELHRQARTLLERVAPEIEPARRVASLSLGERQMVEIAKALSRGARVIAFDEPTSSLSARETDRLFTVIRALRDDGCCVLYVTHRLDEVFALCDAATVLRDGRHVKSHASLAGVSRDEIVRAMVGRELTDVYAWSARPRGALVLEVEGLAGPGLAAPITLAVARGEIVGVFGLVGAGRTELLRVLFGAARRTAGRVRVAGRELDVRSPRDAIAAGVALCPEDRRKEGIFPLLSVLENLNVSARHVHARSCGVLDGRWERENARAQTERLAIKAASPAQPIATLSGGNQQKVVFGRWLAGTLEVLLLDEPTRGVDVGARSEIYAILYELARRGVGVLLVSSDLPEVLGVSDRVLVMRRGALSGELARAEATQERVLELALPRAAEGAGR
ncbi:MAG: L-arabinose ABC transporter ATP-binding protein AraG [Planctomycetes bacterium]|nr:L-arabinose ABC transporter ATP-binding protein AraG [Planctomycetota bacterium]